MADVGEPGHAVLVPPVRPGPGVVVGEGGPRVAVVAVVLAHRAPGPLGQVRAPLVPGVRRRTGRPRPVRSPRPAGGARRCRLSPMVVSGHPLRRVRVDRKQVPAPRWQLDVQAVDRSSPVAVEGHVVWSGRPGATVAPQVVPRARARARPRSRRSGSRRPASASPRPSTTRRGLRSGRCRASPSVRTAASDPCGTSGPRARRAGSRRSRPGRCRSASTGKRPRNTGRCTADPRSGRRGPAGPRSG